VSLRWENRYQRSRLSGFSYEQVGATTGPPPVSYQIGHSRTIIGATYDDVLAARAALQEWGQLRLSWISVYPNHVTASAGQTLLIAAHFLGVTWFNPVRIVYVEDAPTCIAYAGGTLQGHAARGEERFEVKWDEHTQTVSYDILAYSRTNRWYTFLGFPLLQSLQRRFRRDSTLAMQEAVAGYAKALVR
jgi:uncharacterized protein (UPF0548 family)